MCVEVSLPSWRRSSRCYQGECVEVAFVKSRRSADTACVEVGFVKSSRSSDSFNCVEVGGCACGSIVYLRDSKDPTGPVLDFNPDGWAAFLAGVRDGEFDLTDR